MKSCPESLGTQLIWPTFGPLFLPTFGKVIAREFNWIPRKLETNPRDLRGSSTDGQSCAHSVARVAGGGGIRSAKIIASYWLLVTAKLRRFIFLTFLVALEVPKVWEPVLVRSRYFCEKWKYFEVFALIWDLQKVWEPAGPVFKTGPRGACLGERERFYKKTEIFSVFL